MVFTFQQRTYSFISYLDYKWFLIDVDICTILLTEITAVQKEVALSYHKVRGLYFMAVIFAWTIYTRIKTICSLSCTSISVYLHVLGLLKFTKKTLNHIWNKHSAFFILFLAINHVILLPHPALVIVIVIRSTCYLSTNRNA